MPAPADPIRPADADARNLARTLIAGARYAALAVLDPDTGGPNISRIAFATGPEGAPLSLLSDLAQHARALRADPRAALLIGEPGPRGDPLTHPRLSLQVAAQFLDPDAPARAALRARYLDLHPKAQLYIDFADFRFVRFDVTAASLVAGFGRAYRLTTADLGLG